MIFAWRVDREKFIKKYLDNQDTPQYGLLYGTGGLYVPGRWHDKGRRVVYLSDHISLAILEKFVHLGKFYKNIVFYSIRVDIPEEVDIKEVTLDDIATADKKWRDVSAIVPRKIGNDWLSKRETAVLKVPSAILPVIDPPAHNYLLNPEHRDMENITYRLFGPFNLDSRMWK